MTPIGNSVSVAATTDEDTMAGKVSRSARCLIENQKEGEELIGFVSIAVYANGAYSLGFCCPEDQPFMGPTMFTAYVKEVIERELTGRMAADDYAREYLS